MPRSRLNQDVVWRIIRALLWPLLTAALLGGCSMVRLGYGQLPNLSHWWVDGYLDLSTPQSEALRADLQALHSWHRRQELPLLARDLAELRAQAGQDTTAVQVCQMAERFKARLEVVLTQAEPAFARLAMSIKPEQLQHLKHQLDKREQTWRDEWLNAPPAEIQARRLERLVERSESFYGPLTDAQTKLLRAGVMATPYDTALAEQESLRRHQDLQHTLRTLAGGTPTLAQAQDSIRALLVRTLQSPNTSYRAQIDQLVQANCDTFAQLHNSASPEQRQKMATKLKGLEDDARALMAH
ncbi:DUF6279 family lipoprotein [Rhodoferax sp. U2-2l]|uniref:DUF6279 family lipoprotein n=1 Tax=Rhodoferax sp. U2-2l TaxID=2884000 RepID=UPI001D0A2E68|nr:DUF6279 family lipoprotein [Rhodoferax sp. U2-2l]MCB8745638.1 DUF6279 family lipoprotein [Rhodoferax sp. U2-2l]